MKSEVYKDQLDKKEYAHNLEVRLQRGYIQALNQKDTIWWGNEIRNLDREIREEKDPYKLQALNRIKSFISMASYSYCNASLKDNDLESAARLIKIYHTIDPANPDVNYFSALYYFKTGQPVRAEEYFRKAVRSGFKDLKKASNELPPEIYKAGLSPEL